MSLISTIIEIVAPVILLAGMGFVWIKLGFEFRVQFVTQLAMTIGVPALIFTALQKTEIDPQSLTIVSIAAVVAYLVVTLVAYALVKLTKIDVQTYLAPLIFGNTGNLGLPLAYFAFGEEGFGYALVIFAIMIIYSFTFGIWLVSGGGSILMVLKQPTVGATLLGALFLWKGWKTPVFLTNTLELVGQIAIPLMLITLGVALAQLSPDNFKLPVFLSVVKFVFSVVIAWVVGRWFNLPPMALGVLILQISTPVAVTSYLLAEKYEADSASVAGLVVASTLLSIVALPLILAFVI